MLFVKVPAKIKVCLWLLFNRDVLKHRGGEHDTCCLFCSREETIDHLFVQCPLARFAWSVVQCAFDIRTGFNSVDDVISWVFKFPTGVRSVIAVGETSVLWAIWKTRNVAYFDKVFPYDPSVVIVKVAHWLNAWCEIQIRG